MNINFYVLTLPRIKPESTVSVPDALSTWPLTGKLPSVYEFVQKIQRHLYFLVTGVNELVNQSKPII